MTAAADAELRRELISALKGGQAHALLEDVVADFPASLRGQRLALEKGGLPYSAWQLLEHIRIAQNDILRFCANQDGGYRELRFPLDYWPESASPPEEGAWENSINAICADRAALAHMVRDERNPLTAPFGWGEGQTLMREVLLVIDHTAYHLGELVALRRLLGIWK